jgi:hypothetical protein
MSVCLSSWLLTRELHSSLTIPFTNPTVLDHVANVVNNYIASPPSFHPFCSAHSKSCSSYFMIFEVKIRANSEPSIVGQDLSVDSLVLRLLLFIWSCSCQSREIHSHLNKAPNDGCSEPVRHPYHLSQAVECKQSMVFIGPARSDLSTIISFQIYLFLITSLLIHRGLYMDSIRARPSFTRLGRTLGALKKRRHMPTT